MPDSNPSERLAEIEARVEAAIPGPWLRMGTEISKPTVDIVRWSYEGLPPSEWEDATEDIAPTLDFIAHAREDIPWLLEREKKLREALERILAYWKPHTGLHDVLDSIAEIASKAPVVERVRDYAEGQFSPRKSPPGQSDLRLLLAAVEAAREFEEKYSRCCRGEGDRELLGLARRQTSLREALDTLYATAPEGDE